jgi:2-iminoacetate synthase
MSWAKSSHIHEFCQPNAILTFQEYLCDYASPATIKEAVPVIEAALAQVEPKLQDECKRRLARIKQGERDLYF